MGKDLKGKELGIGVSQRKDGLYTDANVKGENIRCNTQLFYYCDKAGIPGFSMHVLRHTFAARCIEGGMRPKTLQVILGHANVGITMNLYVHVTGDEKVKEVERIESALKIV
ncbi:MAG: tyrosine-type recombinase/integrase [Lachnospiraceae bacterium]|nr:tyrosine-type recombinase/integrase [Lachnospiraceae bacterium]